MSEQNKDAGKSVKELEEEAKDYIWSGNTADYMCRKAGTFVLFKKDKDSLMKYAYVCPECGNEDSGKNEFEKPYALKCSKCDNLIFKQEKIKGKNK